MRNILILGAAGQIAQQATFLFLEQLGIHLTLFLRDARRLRHLAGNPHITLLEGDVRQSGRLLQALEGQHVVYANLCGDMAALSLLLVQAMQQSGVQRLIFVSAMGVYDEVPGQQFGSVLQPYKQATATIEASGLDYTIIRPAWLNNRDEISYGISHKGEPFVHPDATVSRKSVADLVVKLADERYVAVKESLGVHKP